MDPASGSTSRCPGPQSQGQPQAQPPAPPALSITVTPLAAQLNLALADGDADAADDLLALLGPISPQTVARASQSLYEDIVDDVILGVVFEVHRGIKLGLTALLEEGIPGIPFRFCLVKSKLLTY